VEVSSSYLEYEGTQYVCSFVRDERERRRVQETLRETEAQLRQSQKMEAIGQLAGGIAHDFNNLLTAIRGYSDLIIASDGSRREETLSDVREIRTAADRAAALTGQILAFSRRQTLQPEVLSLNHVVAEAERLLGRTLGEHVELITILSPDLGQVEVDAAQMSHVLMNLAVNARDAMSEGGTIAIETANVEVDDRFRRAHGGIAPGRYVMLAVSDTGVGMDEETMSRVFDPFFTTKEQGKGTGLGLATVYGTVRQSGGSVYVRSEPGKGSRFEIYLPRVDMPVGGRRLLPAASPAEGGGEKILVVEDEPGVRTLVARVLGGLGYEVVSAADGEEALAQLRSGGQSFDLLFTDVVLPGGLHGSAVAAAASELHPDLPVLFMSGHPRDVIGHAGRVDPAVNLLEKPFAPDALAAKVRQVLDAVRRRPGTD
jgi:nitrogen-specific signal transduction histidine kinase/ActR/RegA family two-component response regulator